MKIFLSQLYIGNPYLIDLSEVEMSQISFLANEASKYFDITIISAVNILTRVKAAAYHNYWNNKWDMQEWGHPKVMSNANHDFPTDNLEDFKFYFQNANWMMYYKLFYFCCYSIHRVEITSEKSLHLPIINVSKIDESDLKPLLCLYEVEYSLKPVSGCKCKICFYKNI